MHADRWPDSMNESSKPNALVLDLEDWRRFIQSLTLDSLFVTVSGAHIYGFPSADSDVDLRGCHRLPLEKVVGLTMSNQTVDRMEIRNGLEVDIVSHDVGKYLGLLVKNNGYILEQVFSPIVVNGDSFLDELRPIAKKCITKNHYYHYRGFYANQRKLIAKSVSVTAKSVLYAYRVLATGIYLMNTGEVVTDLNQLASELKIPDIPQLIESKIAEKVEFEFDLNKHLQRLNQLEKRLDQSFEDSKLPENPERDPVNRLLLDVRFS